MVRAAYEGCGALFSDICGFVSGVNGMANGTHDDRPDNAGKSGKPLPDDAALSARLGRLDRRLSTIKESHKAEADQAEGQEIDATVRASALARGFRLSSELVAGVVVGAAIGWGIDYAFSTSPWGLIIFFLLGFAAGVMNLMRAAGVAPDIRERLKDPPSDR
jgi:ATP synthase protein I